MDYRTLAGSVLTSTHLPLAGAGVGRGDALGRVSFSQTGGGSPLTYKGRNLNHVHGGEARIKPGTSVAPVRFPQTRER